MGAARNSLPPFENFNRSTFPTQGPGEPRGINQWGQVGYFGQTFFDHLTFSQDANVGKHTVNLQASNVTNTNSFSVGPTLDASVTQTNRSQAKDCYNLMVIVPRKAGESLDNDPGILVCAIMETSLVVEIDYDMDDILNLNFTPLFGTIPSGTTLTTDAQLTPPVTEANAKNIAQSWRIQNVNRAAGGKVPSLTARRMPIYNNPYESTAHVTVQPYGDAGEGDNIQLDTILLRMQVPQGWTQPVTRKPGKHAFVGVEEEDSNDSIDCELLG